MAPLYYALATLRDRFEDKERGATAVEYGLIIALIAAVIVSVVGFLGGEIRDAFQDVLTAIQGAGGGGGGGTTP